MNPGLSQAQDTKSRLSILENNLLLNKIIGKLVCGGRSGAIWLPSHHLGGCCTLVVVEEIPSFM